MRAQILRIVGIFLVFVGFGHSYSLDMLTVKFFAWTVFASVGLVIYGHNYGADAGSR